MKPLITLLSNGVFIFSTIALAGQAYPASTDHAPPAWFIDVTAKAGITFATSMEASSANVTSLKQQVRVWPSWTKTATAGLTSSSSTLLTFRVRAPATLVE